MSPRRFHEITDAYEVLGDARRRRDYDLQRFASVAGVAEEGEPGARTRERPSHANTDLDEYVKAKKAEAFQDKMQLKARMKAKKVLFGTRQGP